MHKGHFTRGSQHFSGAINPYKRFRSKSGEIFNSHSNGLNFSYAMTIFSVCKTGDCSWKFSQSNHRRISGDTRRI